MTTGNKLKTVRQKLYINQAEMAASLGITQSHYSNLESDKKNIAAHLITALFEVLKVSPSWFFKEEGEMFSEPITPKSNNGDISSGNISHANQSPYNSPFDIPEGHIGNYCIREKLGLNTSGDDISAQEYIANRNIVSDEKIMDILHSYQKKALRSYYQQSDRALENRMAIVKREYKELYNDYYMLIEAIGRFKLDNYSTKFEMPFPWNERISKIEKDMDSEYSGVEDNKLKLVFYILEYEDEADTIKNALHMAIVKFNETSKIISEIQSMPEFGEKNDQN